VVVVSKTDVARRYPQHHIPCSKPQNVFSYVYINFRSVLCFRAIGVGVQELLSLPEFSWTSAAKKKTLSFSGLLKFAFQRSSVIPTLVRYKDLDIITLLHCPALVLTRLCLFESIWLLFGEEYLCIAVAGS
jgi:hypothetical protein